MRRRPALVLPLVTVGALLLAACGGPSSGGDSSPAGASPGGLSGEITVLAAASLTGSFQTLGKQFQEANPGTTVTFSFGASSALVTQIAQGAPADVFASASQKNMDAVVAAGAATTATPFAENAMQIAVPPKNPGNVTRLSDLARPGVKVALCQAEVPCGATAAKVFATAKLTVKPVTEEADVKATLAKVSLGEVDAGVVYVTDVLAAGDSVTGIEIPADVNASTTYPIAPLTTSKNTAVAQAFVDYVLSAEGQKVLTAAGFQAP
ncbi:molybdate ABC transporter substrate-binding protein [Kineosporia sp. A_224]|uniref:molybdate ABC transporter substrate-binding protein n=1 Tax=Kineosporia sp. A_224 TaxID=1962180 RepID=UPI000B4BC1F9|nr:molybdate ABC transporter substrate-binding protein [Kineosporia sp. A_224]